MINALTSKAKVAAEILVARRMDGTQGERLPETCRPLDVPSALAIQAAVTDRWCELMDDSIGGWKCGLPSSDKIIIAPIYTRTIDSIAPVAVWPKANCARIEPEFAFFFGSDLSPREQPYLPQDVDNAIARTHLALELIGSRYATPADCNFPEMLADGLVNQGLFIGPEIDGETARIASEFALLVTTSTGEHSQHQARHPNAQPRAPLYWLVEFLRARGEGIIAGQAVITGSFAGVIDVPLHDDVEINYVGLGSLNVTFAAKT